MSDFKLKAKNELNLLNKSLLKRDFFLGKFGFMFFLYLSNSSSFYVDAIQTDVSNSLEHDDRKKMILRMTNEKTVGRSNHI